MSIPSDWVEMCAISEIHMIIFQRMDKPMVLCFGQLFVFYRTSPNHCSLEENQSNKKITTSTQHTHTNIYTKRQQTIRFANARNIMLHTVESVHGRAVCAPCTPEFCSTLPKKRREKQNVNNLFICRIYDIQHERFICGLNECLIFFYSLHNHRVFITSI